MRSSTRLEPSLNPRAIVSISCAPDGETAPDAYRRTRRTLSVGRDRLVSDLPACDYRASIVQEPAMSRMPSALMLIVPGLLAAFAGSAISAPDKYTLQVPGGLAFAEFKGYEDWQTVSVSQTEEAFALILA